MKIFKYFLVALLVIMIDHTFKLMVYSSMTIHEEVNVIGQWFRLHYLLNPGMAFGIRWENEFGKLALTSFRIAAMVAIGWYLYRSADRKAHGGFLVCLALILGGAVGNVIDSIFYGVFLNNAPPNSPTPWFHGQVIDMLYFPLFNFTWPSWVPMVGGENFEFFSPVFNIADSSIFIGVLCILIFQRRFFGEKEFETQVSGDTTSHASEPTLVHDNGIPDVQLNAEENNRPPAPSAELQSPPSNL